MRAWLLLALWSHAAHAESCSFDHQLVTLPARSFLAVKAFFRDPKNQKKIGAIWRDGEDDQKGFLGFADQTYLEVWNQAKWDRYGYQDACRVDRKDSLEQLAKGYGVKPGSFGSFMVAGRQGLVGDPRGGMFFIWDPGRKVEPGKPGIRQILKLVAPAGGGELNNEIIDDYRKAGLDVRL